MEVVVVEVGLAALAELGHADPILLEVKQPNPKARMLDALPANLVLLCASESSITTCYTLRLVCTQLRAMVTGTSVRMLVHSMLAPEREEQHGIFTIREVLLSRWAEADNPVRADALAVCSCTQMSHLLYSCAKLCRDYRSRLACNGLSSHCERKRRHKAEQWR